MHLIQDIISFTHHRLHSRKWDYFHSPYLFQLFSYCCEDSNRIAGLDQIESARNTLLNSREMITPEDFGAGHQGKKNHKETSIARIAQRSLSSPFQCRFMARLARFHRPQTIVEFGTSLGISGAYLATGGHESKVITIEGDPSVAAIARGLFTRLEIGNIELINEPFESFIKNRIPFIDKIDLLFLDGHHRKDALLSYYQKLKNKFHADTIIIVDDLYWSAEMTSAWEEIIHAPEVTQSVDCFQFGLLFFTSRFQARENHCVRLPLKSFIRN